MDRLLHRIRATAPAWAALLLVAMIALAAASLPALAGSTSSPKTAAEWGAAWIAAEIKADGKMNGSVGMEINAALALAAAGVERDAFDRTVTFIEQNYETWVPDKPTNNTNVNEATAKDRPGALGFVSLVANAAGKNPRSFGGSDLVQRIEARRQTTGADAGMYGGGDVAMLQGGAVWLHSFAMLGLSAAGVLPHPTAVQWLKQQQCPQGGWEQYRLPGERDAGTACETDKIDTDATAVAIQALKASGDGVPASALNYLQSIQNDEGGFFSIITPDQGTRTNTHSTALAAQAIVAMGEDPRAGRWRQPDGDSVIKALLKYQVDCGQPGAGGWRNYSSGASIATTSQAVWGASLKAFPLTFGAQAATRPQICQGTWETWPPSPSPSATAPASPSADASPSASPSPSPTTDSGATSPAIPAPSPSPTATGEQRSVQRMAGDDRFDSSANVAQDAFTAPVPVAILATGSEFADALAAGPAGAHLRGPVLLTTRDRLPDSVANELARLRPQRIIVLGGTAATSDAVVQEANRYGNVERVSGPDRYETASALSRAIFHEPVRRLLIATGEDFPDALAGIGAAPDGPMLLVTEDNLPIATESELHRLGPFEIFVLGGPSAVSDSVVAKIRAATGAVVERLSGTDRFATAVEITRTGIESADVLYVAAGDRFADALPGAAAAGARATGILLVGRDHVPTVVLDEIRRIDPARIIVLGGTSSVSEQVLQQLRAA